MEAAVPAEEGGVGEEALPELADEGGAEEAAGLVRREAEEDLSDGVVGQLRRRELRCHGAGGFGLGDLGLVGIVGPGLGHLGLAQPGPGRDLGLGARMTVIWGQNMSRSGTSSVYEPFWPDSIKDKVETREERNK